MSVGRWAGRQQERVDASTVGRSSVKNFVRQEDDSLNNWCHRRILNIHWTEFVTNDEVRSSTGQPLLSDTVRSRRLSFSGHVNRADPCHDHYRALQACIAHTPPADWRRRPGRPRQSWLRTVETDLRPLNLGLASAARADASPFVVGKDLSVQDLDYVKRRTQDRAARRRLVATTTSTLTSS